MNDRQRDPLRLTAANKHKFALQDIGCRRINCRLLEWNWVEQFALIPEESIFLDLTPEESALFFFILGLVISQSLSIDELNLLANGLFETAQIMFVIASHRTLINDVLEAQADKEKGKTEHTKPDPRSAPNMQSELKKLQDQINHLQKQIEALTT